MPDDDRERLRQHFLASGDPSTHPARWNDLWASSFLPWDRGTPNPALVDLLSNPPPNTLAAPQLAPPKDAERRVDQKVRRPRALVPGCGRGYDVRLLAACGWDAVGVEASEVAVDEARKAAEAGRGGDGEGEGEGDGDVYRTRDERVGRGSVRFVVGDFFAREWEAEVGVQEEGGWDLVYDYTVSVPPLLLLCWNG